MERERNIIEEEESIPSSESVEAVFDQLVEGHEYREERRLEDEQGVYLWEVVTSIEEGDTKYSYMRAGRYPEGQASVSVVHSVFLDEEGMPVGGTSVAEYVDDQWVLVD